MTETHKYIYDKRKNCTYGGILSQTFLLAFATRTKKKKSCRDLIFQIVFKYKPYHRYDTYVQAKNILMIARFSL